MRIWGGPKFRFPMTFESFFEDCYWNRMPTYCLETEVGELVGFGQAYPKLGRAHLARIVVSPKARGRGTGRHLVTAISRAALRDLDCRENSLYAMPHNAAALRCYASVGYEPAPIAEPVPFPVVFMVRREPLNRGSD